MDFKLDLISTPLATEEEVEVFNEKERRKIENYILKSNRLNEIGILISMYSGMRIGEICALRWRDIDFENKSIKVTHTVQRIYVNKNDTKIILTSPKTKKSIREIPLAKILYENLRELSKKNSKEAFILTGREDRLIEPLGYRYTYRRLFKKV